jgi:Zn-dependent protease with chaperone function
MNKVPRGLYLSTLFLELPGVFARFPFAFLIAYLLSPCYLLPFVLVYQGFAGVPSGLDPLDAALPALLDGSAPFGFLLAASPLLLSVLTLRRRVGGYRRTPQALGAREPVAIERLAFGRAFEQIAPLLPPGATAPTHWFVIDSPLPNACVVGSTLYLTRELLDSPQLAAVLAHEYGHLQHDGPLALALRRLVLPPFKTAYRSLAPAAPGAVTLGLRSRNLVCCYFGLLLGLFPLYLALAGGGLGVWMTSRAWEGHWREREFAADEYAWRCGQASGLIQLLSQHEFYDVAVPYYRMEHPYVRQRIDRLMGLVQGYERPRYTAEFDRAG